MRGLHAGPSWVGLLQVLSVALAACDVPTEAPLIDSRWVLPSESTEIEVMDFLPEGVTLSPDGQAFLVTVTGRTQTTTLGEVCTECTQVNGLVVSKPAFVYDVESEASLPSDISDAVMTSGELVVFVRNGFNFDVLRPGSVAGTIDIEVHTLDGVRVGSSTISGATRSLPGQGGTLQETITLSGATLDGLRITAHLDSPEGNAALIDVAGVLDVQAQVRNVRATSAQADLSGEAFDLEPTGLDVSDIEDAFVDRVQSGRAVIDVTNDLGVATDLIVRIEGPTFEPILKSVSVPATAISERTVDFTGEELRRFLGQPDVTFGGTGTVTTASPVEVTPGQIIGLDIVLDITLRIGG